MGIDTSQRSGHPERHGETHPGAHRTEPSDYPGVPGYAEAGHQQAKKASWRAPFGFPGFGREPGKAFPQPDAARP